MRQSNAVRVVLIGVGAVGLACSSPQGSGAPGRASATASASAAPRAAMAVPSASAAAAPAPARPAPAAPQAAAPEGRLFVDCYAGFAPGATPRIDVQRLALSCGPSTGLTPFARAAGTVDESGAPQSFRWEAKRGDCFRLFAVASAPVDDLEVEIVQSPAEHGSLTNQNRRWVVVAEDRPFCAARAGTFVARLTTHGGRGAFAASVFRGERMLPKR